MKLKFTHKTWYFFLLCAAAASMLNGFAVLSGTSFARRSWVSVSVSVCVLSPLVVCNSVLAASRLVDPPDGRRRQTV